MIQHVLLDLDEIRLSKDDDLNRLNRLARRVFDILDLWHDPNQINVRHRLARQTRHDTETSDLDLDLPINDLVFERSDQDLSSLVLVLRPTDDLRLLVARESEFFSNGPLVVVHCADRLVSLQDDTELVELDTVMGPHEDERCKKGGDEGNEEEETVKDGTDREITSRLETLSHRPIVDDQSPREVELGRCSHVKEV
jgi:hypothetical protein